MHFTKKIIYIKKKRIKSITNPTIFEAVNIAHSQIKKTKLAKNFENKLLLLFSFQTKV